MIFGMSTATYTLVHVVISLMGIASGFVVLYGLLAGRRLDRWTALFLTTTVLTSVTGYGFRFEHLLPSHIVGAISLVVLAIAIFARHVRHLAGVWRSVYVVTATLALYLNVFVAIVQSFLKVPALKALAPKGNEPPFLVTQFFVLILFVVLSVFAVQRFRGEPVRVTARAALSRFLFTFRPESNLVSLSLPVSCAGGPDFHPSPPKEKFMPTITTKDGTQIYYKDWGTGQPIVFSHGWPLSADDWEGQMLYFGQVGYRVIAHDRRGHGRSTQTWDGNDMDTYADDLAALTEKLDLKNAIHVGHSTGGGEVARYIGRHGTKRVGMAVLISAVPPLMLKTEKNPGGLPIAVFDGLRAELAKNRSQFYRDITLPFYGYNRPGAKISEGIREHWWLQGMLGGNKAHYDCIKAFSETDFTEDLKKFDVPTLILHGDDDQIVPIGAAALMSAKIVKNAKLKVYPGFPHGMPTTHADQINADLLAFIKQSQRAAA